MRRAYLSAIRDTNLATSPPLESRFVLAYFKLRNFPGQDSNVVLKGLGILSGSLFHGRFQNRPFLQFHFLICVQVVHELG